MDQMESVSYCPFCVLAGVWIVSAEKANKGDIFYRDDYIIAFISAGWWPNNLGSVLIIPKTHHRNIYDIPKTLYDAVNDFGRRLAVIMKLEYECDGISFRQDNEEAGGQSVEHSHLWVFPRYQNESSIPVVCRGVCCTGRDAKSICAPPRKALPMTISLGIGSSQRTYRSVSRKLDVLAFRTCASFPVSRLYVQVICTCAGFLNSGRLQALP
jgi:histidine triad (HIT) family protein